MATIFREGIKRMHEKKENIFYYITAMNENYSHPEKPKGSDEGILKGMYLFKEGGNKGKTKVQLLGSGTILREIIAASKILSKEYNIDSDIWSVTSFNELRRNGMETERVNLLNPNEKPKKTYVQKCLDKRDGPVIAASDYTRAFADQIRPYTDKTFYSFGTDGYGRSDTRKNLRKFFEVDKEHIVAFTLSALAKEQLIGSEDADKAIKKFKIDKNRDFPANL
jgi:pyruvate dehydrogenase E1 component